MTKETLAMQLNGNQYGDEISGQLEKQAKDAGLVVVFGGGDDLIEFRGAIHDERGVADGGDVFMVDGKLWDGPDCDHRGEGCKYAKAVDEKVKATSPMIEALWCQEKPYCWTYKTDIPHATFDVLEDGEKFCRGIVFSLADL